MLLTIHLYSLLSRHDSVIFCLNWILTSEALVCVSFQDDQGTSAVTLDRFGQIKNERIFSGWIFVFSLEPGRRQPNYFCPVRRFLSAQCQLEINHLNFHFWTRFLFVKKCLCRIKKSWKKGILPFLKISWKRAFYRFWTQKTSPYNPPLRPHWWDILMKISQYLQF